MIWTTDFDTKRAFRYAVGQHPHQVFVKNPAPFEPFYGSLSHAMRTREMITVTNHPKRSWFAQVTRRPDGSIKVE